MQTLATMGSQHGYAIAARLEQISDGALQLNMGTLYPGLVRLEAKGWIAAAWKTTESNRRARYYSLTKAGQKRLALEKTGWERTASIMSRILEGEP